MRGRFYCAGKEDQLRGQLDVINKKAIIYSENDQLGRLPK